MLVSFDTPRFYRGREQAKVQIRTGLGGGDCGYRFEIGRRYLVYAYSEDSGELSTGICSATALIEDSEANLEYLRNEPITADKVTRSASSALGSLCGRVLRSGRNFSDGRILLFAAGDKSPLPSDEADLDESGSFCVEGVSPGKYRLLFMNESEGSPTPFAFFPGTAEPSKATEIEVTSSHSNPALVLDVPDQNTFSVGGMVQLSNASKLPNECKVFLMNVDAQLFALDYSQDVKANGSFTIPSVLPGKYWAFVAIEPNSPLVWQTRKVEVDVNENIADLALSLIAP